MRALLVCIAFWAVIAAVWAFDIHAAPAPSPDPSPGTNRPISYVGYWYWTPAVDTKGRVVPGLWFHCHISAAGKKRCILYGN